MQSMNSTMAGAAGGRSLAKRMTMMASFGAVGLAGFGISLIITPGSAVQTKLPLLTAVAASAAPAPTAAQPAWLAAAPGRIEPRSGLIRIGAALPGRVNAISVRINDKVAEGEVLMRLDDKERTVGADIVVRASIVRQSAGADLDKPSGHSGAPNA